MTRAKTNTHLKNYGNNSKRLTACKTVMRL